MNNKLIANIYINEKRKDLLCKVVPELERLINNGSKFTKEESIKALSIIRDKVVMLQEELKNTFVAARKMRWGLRQACTHEILVKKDYYYECAICDECFKLDSINFDAFLVECLETDYYLYNVILADVISDIAINNKDIFEVFEDMLYERYKKRNDIDNLLVYRRSR